MFKHSHIRHFSSVFVSLRDFQLITQNSSENITSRQSRCIYVNGAASLALGSKNAFLAEYDGLDIHTSSILTHWGRLFEAHLA